jgi:hypothetical protein
MVRDEGAGLIDVFREQEVIAPTQHRTSDVTIICTNMLLPTITAMAELGCVNRIASLTLLADTPAGKSLVWHMSIRNPILWSTEAAIASVIGLDWYSSSQVHCRLKIIRTMFFSASSQTTSTLIRLFLNPRALVSFRTRPQGHILDEGARNSLAQSRPRCLTKKVLPRPQNSMNRQNAKKQPGERQGVEILRG